MMAPEAAEIGADAGDAHAAERQYLLDRRDEVVRPDAFPEVAKIDHQHDVVDAAHALGDARYFADGGELGLQADVDSAHHLLDARHRRTAQQHDRGGDAAVAQPADVFEARFGDAGDAAAQHGTRHLRHAASALGDAEDLDAGQGAAVDDGARIALDAAKVDGDLRSRHFSTQNLCTVLDAFIFLVPTRRLILPQLT
jgi:hypothetical protein